MVIVEFNVNGRIFECDSKYFSTSHTISNLLEDCGDDDNTQIPIDDYEPEDFEKVTKVNEYYVDKLNDGQPYELNGYDGFWDNNQYEDPKYEEQRKLKIFEGDNMHVEDPKTFDSNVLEIILGVKDFEKAIAKLMGSLNKHDFDKQHEMNTEENMFRLAWWNYMELCTFLRVAPLVVVNARLMAHVIEEKIDGHIPRIRWFMRRRLEDGAALDRYGNCDQKINQGSKDEESNDPKKPKIEEEKEEDGVQPMEEN